MVLDERRVIRSTRSAAIVSAALLVASMMGTVPRAQGTGALAGVVTDSSSAPLPGVLVTVSTPGKSYRVTTDVNGRFRIDGIPAGGHSASAELPAFETVRRDVVIPTSSAVTVSFTLEISCLSERVIIDPGFQWALEEATAILHIQILESGPGERCPRAGTLCVCISHLAAVVTAYKTSSEAPLATIRFLQEGAGRIPDGPGGSEQPYGPGEEYIVFLRHDPVSGRVMRLLSAPLFAYPIRDGKVTFSRTDAPGLRDGMRFDEFGHALQQLLSQPR